MTVEPSDRNGSTAKRCSASPVELLVEVVILAPIGVGTALVDEIPKVVESGRRQLVLARFIGKMVVDHGVRQLRRRVNSDGVAVSPQQDSSPARRVERSSEPPPPPPADIGRVAIEQTDFHRADTVAEEHGPVSTVAVEELVLPDYDLLPAAHIVAKLPSLDQAERDVVEQYERTHRHRRTILGKLDQLRKW